MKHTYSNPRLSVAISDWPYGAYRTTATFVVEAGTRGERATRMTINPKNGRPSAAKVTTYAIKTRIVDGDDGRTYILRFVGSHFDITQGNLQFTEESVFPGQEGYKQLEALIQ